MGISQRDSVVKDVLQNLKCKSPMHRCWNGVRICGCQTLEGKRLSRWWWGFRERFSDDGESRKCFPWLLRRRKKRQYGTLCGNILWLKSCVFCFVEGADGRGTGERGKGEMEWLTDNRNVLWNPARFDWFWAERAITSGLRIAGCLGVWVGVLCGLGQTWARTWSVLEGGKVQGRACRGRLIEIWRFFGEFGTDWVWCGLVVVWARTWSVLEGGRGEDKRVLGERDGTEMVLNWWVKT